MNTKKNLIEPCIGPAYYSECDELMSIETYYMLLILSNLSIMYASGVGNRSAFSNCIISKKLLKTHTKQNIPIYILFYYF